MVLGIITFGLGVLHRGEGDPIVHRMIERHTIGRHDDVPLFGKLEVP